MGLDMYLVRRIYVGANYDFNRVHGTISLTRFGEPVKVNMNKVTYIEEEAGYWRKANAIHKWFVDNVQDGEDDCKTYEVSYEELIELKDLCQKVLDTKDGTLLPPQEGFFFGGTDIDEYYFEDLQNTIKIIESLDPEGCYQYHSSW